jgi:Amt family ammonium transporter
VIPGGWVNHNHTPGAYPGADSVAGFSYSFVVTCVILFLLNLIPGLSLRVSPEDEDTGIDDGQLGEFAYDYVELQRHTSDIIAERDIIHARSGSSKGSVPEKAPRELV